MHIDFIDILCCPRSGSPLKIQNWKHASGGRTVLEAELVAEDGTVYPVINGIPRFVAKELYASSFGFEWKKWPRVQFDSENIGKPMEGHTSRMWQAITNASDEDVHGKTIVDFGCGAGRFLDVVRSKGGRAVGIDMSQAVEVARSNFEHNSDVLIVQGDVLNPPFRESFADGGYTIGVLHHTPEPQRGLSMLARCIKPGGWVSCCVYPKGEFYDYPSVARFRRLNKLFYPLFGHRPALAYSHFAAHYLTRLLSKAKRTPALSHLASLIERNWLVILEIPDVRWRLLDIFDAITPEFASTHTQEEVKQWLLAANCDSISASTWCATALNGVKRIKHDDIFTTVGS